MTRTVELVFFDGCPNADAARENLRAALESVGWPPHWTEWDQLSDRLPDRVNGYASPAILVDGQDITGARRELTALACRTGPAPNAATIREALLR